MDLKDAMKTLKFKLMSDSDYHRGWRDNISCKIQDYCGSCKSDADIASEAFLEQLMFHD